jgi:two-component sensor histidine kinase
MQELQIGGTSLVLPDLQRGPKMPSLRQIRRFVRPNSIGAYVFAGACIIVGTALRVAIGWIDPAAAPFTVYFPILLVIASLCGAAVALVTLAVILIVGWWAFIPPYYEFAEITLRALLDMLLFALASIAAIWLADSYRRVVDAFRVEKRERELLFDELIHRGKNTFAVVSFIITSSLEEQKDRAREIVERVKAVSATNDLITGSKTQTVILKQILDQEFAPYSTARVTLSGARIELSANAGRGFALIVHELVTNAVKHGALSSSPGSIEIVWFLEGERVRLSWIERGGPQISAPWKPGFGTRLVTRTLRGLGGEITSAFPPEGLVCVLKFNPK